MNIKPRSRQLRMHRKELRKVAIMARVRETERDLFERCAHDRGLSLSAWMRMSLLMSCKKGGVVR